MTPAGIEEERMGKFKVTGKGLGGVTKSIGMDRVKMALDRYLSQNEGGWGGGNADWWRHNTRHGYVGTELQIQIWTL